MDVKVITYLAKLTQLKVKLKFGNLQVNLDRVESTWSVWTPIFIFISFSTLGYSYLCRRMGK